MAPYALLRRRTPSGAAAWPPQALSGQQAAQAGPGEPDQKAASDDASPRESLFKRLFHLPGGEGAMLLPKARGVDQGNCLWAGLFDCWGRAVACRGGCCLLPALHVESQEQHTGLSWARGCLRHLHRL